MLIMSLMILVKKNTAHVDFNEKNLDNVRFDKVNSMPAVEEHLTARNYVDNAIFFCIRIVIVKIRS